MPTRHAALRPVPRHRALSNCALGALLLALPVALAPSAALAAMTSHLVVSSAESGVTQHLSVALNKSIIVDLPTDAREVIVSAPTVAGAVMHSKRRAIVQGTGVGETNIIFLDARGAPISTLDVSVVKDASTLATAIASMLPGSQIQAQSFGDHVVLSGSAESQDDVAKAVAIATQFAGGAGNVASIVSVAGAQQVMLKVTVAEVSRSAVRQLGIDLTGSLDVGALATGIINPSSLGGASSVVTGNAITAGFSVPGASLKATFRALEQRGLLRTLDEPTLTAMSGQSAEFLAGGEFPVPTAVDNLGQVSYTFKQFGVKLDFTPTVKSNGIIGIVVDTSVSEVTTQDSVSVNGIVIPGTKNREAKTSVELPAGATLSIGGLYEDKQRQQISSLPGIGRIPILGALFRSRDFLHDQTELMILVTPYLAKAGAPPASPTDGVTAAGDAEANFLGHMEKIYGVGDPTAHTGNYQGQVGFVLD